MVAVVSASSEPEEDGKEGKFFIKSYSTTTWTYLSSFTSTVPYTCYTTADAVMPCSQRPLIGRKVRRSRLRSMDQSNDEVELLSSIKEDTLADTLADTVGESERQKFFFTMWRTGSTTVTVTTYSTNRSVTVSISAMCTYPGITLNLC
ncbi:uncharacterized protein [Procambarus clarkii]|uniref:uncharacterized protein n=1 Tax=Procambarus clarkii TaxID=6728 RepID=UPI00374375AE